MPKHKSFHRYLVALLLSLFCLISASSVSFAATATNPTLQSVAQSYGTTTSLQQGLIVQLDPKNANDIIADSYANAKKMQGVVVAASNAPVTLSDSTSAGQQAYVANSGRYNVLVSDQNGSISAGDYISISNLDGIGMKADTLETQILGRAVSGFDGQHNVESTTTLTTSQGKQLKVALGSIPVDLGIGVNPLLATGNNGVPKAIQKLAISLVGKPISALRLYLGMAIVLIGISVVASLLFGGVQSSMTAIGRNPLAKKSIMRNLLQVVVTSIIIFIGSLFAVYLVLKL